MIPMGMCSAYRLAIVTPGLVLRRAGVLVSRVRSAFWGSRRGDESTDVLGVSLRGRSSFSSQFTSRASDRAAWQRNGLITSDLRFLRYIQGLKRVLQYRYGLGLPLYPPPRNGGSALSLALIHPSSWKGYSPKLNFALTAFSEIRNETCNKYRN